MEECGLAFDNSSCSFSAVKVRGRLDVTFADKVCDVAETQATYITDEFD